jgi:hypothetical protein
MTDERDATDGASGADGTGDAGDADATASTGTFLVTAADAESAVLRDVDSGRVHTLSEHPDLAVDDAVEGRVEPDPPLGVTHRLVDVERRWSLSLERSEEAPTTQVRELAADGSVGDLHREPRAGEGELHVLTVPEAETESAVEDVLDDREATLARAARLGVARVEVRSAPGVVSVRYMP